MKYYFLIVSSFIIWSSYGLLIKIFKLDPFALIFYLSLFGIFFIYLYLKKKKVSLSFNIKNIFLIFLASLLLFGNTVTYFYALKFTSITNTILSHYAAPIIAAIFIPLFLNEKIDKKTVIALILSSCGIFLIFFPQGNFYISHNDLIGISLGLASAFCYAFLIIIGKFLMKSIEALYLMFYENIFSMLIILASISFLKQHLIVTYEILLLYFLLGITHNFLAPLMYLEGLKRVKAQHAAVLGYVEPVSAIFLEIIFLKYVPKIGTLIGGFLIIFSGWIIIQRRKVEGGNNTNTRLKVEG